MRHLLFGLLCSAAAVLGIAAWRFVGANSPVLSVPTRVLQFGQVPAGRDVSRSIKISNRGAGDLVISHIRTGCGCTKVSLRPSNRIKPGESAVLEVAITLDRHTASIGKVATVYLFSNDPHEPVARLIAKADPILEDPSYPEVVDFGRVDRFHLPVSREFAIRTGATDRTIAKWVVDKSLDQQPNIEVTSIANSANDQRYRLTLSPSMPTGDFYSILKVHETISEISGAIIIRGHVRGRFVALPQMVAIGPLYKDDATVRELVRIRWREEMGEGVGVLSLSHVQEIRVSDGLERLVEYDLSEEDGAVVLAISIIPGQADHAWSSEQIIGFVQLKIGADKMGSESEVVNVPVSIVMRIPKIRG